MPKTIFITGGSTGIGAASVFANAGIHSSNTLLDEAAPDEPGSPGYEDRGAVEIYVWK